MSSVSILLIPPSVLMIIYALLTDQSIGALFAAGIIPGLLVALSLSLAIWGMVSLNPALEERPLRLPL